MPPRSAKHLEDILLAAARIERFLAGKSFDEYAADDVLRSAVERQFMIVGEAINRIKRDDPTMLDQMTRVGPLVAFRNILVHAYELVDDAKVWQIVAIHLPLLRQEVEGLLTPWTDWPPAEVV